MTAQLHRELIAQAEHLARKEPRRPRQASLRRSVSSSYYALFHFLVDAACRSIVGSAHRRRALRYVLARGFSHATMKNASKSFAGGTLPANIASTMGSANVPQQLQSIADTFQTLQEERHRADYDLSKPFFREETLRLIERVRDAFGLWETVKQEEVSRLYLISLLTWDQLRDK